MSTLISSYAGQTVVCIGAHPDDLEIGMGGTLARLAQAGANVIMAVVAVPDKLEQRITEGTTAASILGAKFEVLDSERCRRVEDLRMYEIVKRLDALVRSHAPAAIFTHSGNEIHVLVHRAVLSTMRLRPMDVYFYTPSTCKPVVHEWQPRIWVDITATLDRKIAAIAAHDSQFGGRGFCVDYFREKAHWHGMPVGMQYAEGLDVLCLRDA
jgi:LmbE family N-acetylglucosaminyl deacetylase